MAGSIDGLGSGLDTSSIISQLMSLEKRSQTRLSTQRQAVLARGTAWTGVETQLTALKGAIDAVKAGGLRATSAVSSAPSAVAVTGAASVPGVHTVDVSRLATAQRFTSPKTTSQTLADPGQLTFHDGAAAIGATAIASSGAATGTYRVEVVSVDPDWAQVRVGSGQVQQVPVGAGGTVWVDPDDPAKGSITLTPDQAASPPAPLKQGTATLTVVNTGANTTLGAVASAINQAAGLLSAVVVSSGGSSPEYRMVLTGARTGEAANVTLSTSGFSGSVLDDAALTALPAPGSPDPLAGRVDALDAEFTFNGIPVQRAANTVTDLIPGSSITLIDDQAGPATITISADPSARAAAGKAVVDSLNGVLRQIQTSSKYDQANKKAGPLTGDSGARALARDLSAAVTEAAKGISGITLGGAPTDTAGNTYTTTNLGMSLQKDGTYAFDAAAFEAALRDKPAETQAFVDAIAKELEKVVTRATSSTGAVGAAKKGVTDLAAQLQEQVDAWDDKLAAIENRLRRQYSALDSAMHSLNSQGSWLASQIAGLQA